METIATKLISSFVDAGPYGVIAALAIIAIYLLFKENKSLQEKRLTENREVVGIIEANTVALENLTEVIRAGRGPR